MSEIIVENEKGILLSGLEENPGLPDELRKWLEYPDELVRERDAIQLHNEWLQAEREEILRYLKNLKMLVINLSGRNRINENDLSNINFVRAEKNLPEYLRNEIEVDVYALGLLS